MMKDFNMMSKMKDGREFLLRSPRVEDAQELIYYMKAVDGETPYLAREVGEFSFTVEQEEAFIRSTLENTDVCFLVAEYNGHIIGQCSVGRNNSTSRFAHRASMGITVSKNYWNNGIGKTLMKACIAWCQENDIEQLELEVVSKNLSAVSLYLGLGFEITGTKKRALKYKDGTYSDEYTMWLLV